MHYRDTHEVKARFLRLFFSSHNDVTEVTNITNTDTTSLHSRGQLRGLGLQAQQKCADQATGIGYLNTIQKQTIQILELL